EINSESDFIFKLTNWFERRFIFHIERQTQFQKHYMIFLDWVIINFNQLSLNTIRNLKFSIYSIKEDLIPFLESKVKYNKIFHMKLRNDFIEGADNIRSNPFLKHLESILDLKTFLIYFEIKANEYLDADLKVLSLTEEIREIKERLFSKDNGDNGSLKINTKFPESTFYIENQLREIDDLNQHNETDVRHFCSILSKLGYLMHANDDSDFYLQRSAENYWNEHKNDEIVNMEKDWFQEELVNFLTIEFPSNVSREPKQNRGNVDFRVFNIPIETKCFNDKKDKNKREKSGLKLLDDEIRQIYQYSSHTNLGIIVAYDFRDEEISKNLKIQSVTERIEFKKLGHKIVAKFVFLKRATPSSIK
ncbi:MAG: hypothetical protein P8Y97_22715, partial [Candidatus Lokiarchaeota archaeon]